MFFDETTNQVKVELSEIFVPCNYLIPFKVQIIASDKVEAIEVAQNTIRTLANRTMSQLSLLEQKV